MSDLSDKQNRFVQEYMIDLNGAQAAIRAGYSPKTAAEQASRLLTKVNVQEAIKIEQAKISAKSTIDKEEIIKRLIKLDDAYNEMIDLAQKETLTTQEEARLMRLTFVVKGSDASKAKDMLNRLQGNYATEKQELTIKTEQALFTEPEDKEE